MAKTISNLAVKISANAESFLTTFAHMTKTVDGFAAGFSETAGKISGYGTAIFAALSGGGMAVLLKTQAEAIIATGRLSDRLGMSTESLVGLQHAAKLAGIDSDTLNTSMSRMMKNLGEAAMNGGKADEAFQRLGLDSRELVNMPADQAMMKLAAAIGEVRNPFERAAIAVKIFGREGQRILPIFRDGAEGLKRAGEETIKLGTAFTRVDAAKVQAAHEAILNLEEVISGIGRTIVVQFAPFVTEAANALVNMATAGEGVGPKIQYAFELVLTMVAKASDYLELLKAGWYTLQVAAGVALWGVAKAVQYVGEAIDWLCKKLGLATTGVGDFASAWSDELVKGVDEAGKHAGESWQKFQAGTNSKAVEDFFAKVRNNANKAAQDVANKAKGLNAGTLQVGEDAAKEAEKAAKSIETKLDTIREKLATFGMSASEKEIYDLQKAGASIGQIEEARKNLGKFDALTEAKKQMDDLVKAADRVRESIQTPMQKYEAQVSQLDKMLSANLLTWDEYGLAIRKAREEMEKAGKSAKDLRPAAINMAGAQGQALKFASAVSRAYPTGGRLLQPGSYFAGGGDTGKQLAPGSYFGSTPFNSAQVAGKQQEKLDVAKRTLKAVESIDRKTAQAVDVSIG